eukprot:COSAG02_NODE_10428_length_1942_cov_1.838307_2_plen_45_part_00
MSLAEEVVIPLFALASRFSYYNRQLNRSTLIYVYFAQMEYLIGI